VALALVLGTAISTLQAIRARRAEKDSDAARTVAEAQRTRALGVCLFNAS
jgi:hypothetical protein